METICSDTFITEASVLKVRTRTNYQLRQEIKFNDLTQNIANVIPDTYPFKAHAIKGQGQEKGTALDHYHVILLITLDYV